MMAGAFSKRDAIGFGWSVAKAQVGFFVLVFVVVLLVEGVPQAISDRTKETMPAFSALINLALFVLGQFISIGLTRISLKLYDGQKPELADLFSGSGVFFKYLFTTIVYAVIVAVGFILLILPGIYWAIRFAASTYVVVDKELGPLEALRESWRLTQGHVWELLLFS